MFGHPNSRARSWRICYHKDKKRWASSHSLQDLAQILLADKNSKTTLTFHSYFFEQRHAHGEVSEDDLSKLLDSCLALSFGKNGLSNISSKPSACCPGTILRSQAQHLDKFRNACPDNQLFDLSANVAKRRRVELKDRTWGEGGTKVIVLVILNHCGVKGEPK